MSHKEITGLVTRAVEYKEADFILTVLTAGEGLLTVTARGARRHNSPHAAPSQVLCCSRMVLSEYRERYTLKEADVVEAFPALRTDLTLMSAACYIAELAQTLAPEGDMFRLTAAALVALTKRPAALVKAAFEMRALCEAGFKPELGSCETCGGASGMMFLRAARGLSLCAGCAPAARDGADLLLPYDGDTLLALRHIAAAPADKVFSFTLGEAPLARLSSLCERYALAHLDMVLPSLEYYRRLL